MNFLLITGEATLYREGTETDC